MSYDFIIGQDTGSLYRIQAIRPARNNAYLKVGSSSKKFYLRDNFNTFRTSVPVTTVNLIAETSVTESKTLDEYHKEISLPSQEKTVEKVIEKACPDFSTAEEKFPVTKNQITKDKLTEILGPQEPKCSDAFKEALLEAHINPELSETQQ